MQRTIALSDNPFVPVMERGTTSLYMLVYLVGTYIPRLVSPVQAEGFPLYYLDLIFFNQLVVCLISCKGPGIAPGI